VLAVVLRALLVAFSPTAFGYVWDFYDEGIQVLYREGRLPVATDCWTCSYPPLFFLLGLPFYAFGKWVGSGSDLAALRWAGGLSLISAAVTIYFGYRLLRLYRCRGASLVLGTAILLVFPCLFISSYGAEADVVLTAILSAFVFYLARYTAQRRSATFTDAARLGVIAGLAAATKYNGVAGVATCGIVMAVIVLIGPHRGRAMAHAAAALALAAIVGGWKYADNWQRYGTPFVANGTAVQGFALTSRARWGRPYEFTTFRLTALRRAIGPRAITGTNLTNLPVYNSVFTTLHALAWSDMSFFSIRSRHGDSSDPYPRKAIPPDLTLSVILLGLVANALSALGAAVTIGRRGFWPLAVLVVVTLAAYVWWILPQPSWALKTKYILFLLPVYVLYLVTGLAWLTRRWPAGALVASGLVAVLVVLAHVYLYAFAVGRLWP
jgi:hypothetical protein